MIFGGVAPEHDVSLVTGLQALNAMDRSRFTPLPVYITRQGQWLVLPRTQQIARRLPDVDPDCTAIPVTLNADASFPPSLCGPKSWGRRRTFAFDVALIALHGGGGENGALQGRLDEAGVPYTGFRTLAASLFMDKVASKTALKGLDVPCLPYLMIPRDGLSLTCERKVLTSLLDRAPFGFPMCLKPVHLGSSIGVARVANLDELEETLPTIFAHDHQAMVEPFVEHLVEYNVAVARFKGRTRTSAIERPKRHSELLDFAQKYRSGGQKGKSGDAVFDQGQKMGLACEQGLALTRDLKPELNPATESLIRASASTIMEAFDGYGAPRLDFYGNEKTGEIWFNELNPCPGSFGYFLWEAAEEPLLFTHLLGELIEEACEIGTRQRPIDDPVPSGARLFLRD